MKRNLIIVVIAVVLALCLCACAPEAAGECSHQWENGVYAVCVGKCARTTDTRTAIANDAAYSIRTTPGGMNRCREKP